MKTTMQFGEMIDGYNIPVLNEREIRAAAGMLFLVIIISFMFVVLKEDFLLMKNAITVFLTDFLIRVFVNPKYSPTLILARLFVRSQAPEYVGAPQKKFAWTIGVVLALVLFSHLVVANSVSPITGIICLICLIFLFFESAFGICLGCKFYPLFLKEKAQYCAGEVCAAEFKHNIQKTSMAQLSVVFGFIVFILAIAFLFNENYSEKPYVMFGADCPTLSMIPS